MGYRECPRCSGTKRIRCGSCGNRPLEKRICDNCRGKGEVTCPSCDGKGTVYVGDRP